MIKSKLPNTPTTIFTKMSALAMENNAINLSQGFPDFPISEDLVDKVLQAMKDGHNQYAPMAGNPKLREVLSSKIESLYNRKVNPDSEITVTAGATQAIYTTITAVLHEDDEVILFEPAYDCYEPAVRLTGAKPIFIPLEFPDYRVDWEMVKKFITGKTKMIIINNPHNPTGKTWSSEDMLNLQKITSDSDIVVLSDEVYEHIVFDETTHESALKYPDLAERTFAIYSFGKTFHCTGWKMGYVVAPQALTTEFRKVHQFNVFSVNTPLQVALAEFLEVEENYNTLPKFYQEKRDHFQRGMQKTPFKPLACDGTYFQLYQYDQISDLGDVAFADQLTIEHGVAAIPMSVFFRDKRDDKVLRFCFAKEKSTLDQAIEKLASL